MLMRVAEVWLNELMSDPSTDVQSIAKREGCCPRKVNTISLAFLAPTLVKAVVDGRPPRRMGVARLTDLPAEWSLQHDMLGLASA
jgi:site-specific DNA recombinase